MGVFGKFCTASALAIALSLLPASSVLARAQVVALSNVRIANFGQISQTYYRGSQPAGADYGDLASLGVKTVIDLQGDGDNADEPQLVKAAGMTFYRIPMTTRVAPTAEQIAQFLDIVNDPARQPVYVHCAGGRHRTGVMTAIYRMTGNQWTPEQAFREMKQYDFGADFLHPEFKRFVYSFKPAAPLAAEAAVAAN